MSWQQTEFILKGIYLGLLVLVAMYSPDWPDVVEVGLYMFSGLVLTLGVAGYNKVREGYRLRGRFLGFILFLILENPGLVYVGLIAGLAIGTYAAFSNRSDELGWAVLEPILGGALLGLGFWHLRRVRDIKLRRYLGLALAALCIGAAYYALFLQPQQYLSAHQRDMIGVLLLLGIPGFYLLTFASMVEESEVEIAVMCAALGMAICFFGDRIPPMLTPALLAIPITIYYLYSRRILPELRVFKHALRGLSYSKVGQVRPALMSLNRALELNPNHHLASETLWDLHRQLDLGQLEADPETLSLVNFGLCLERASWLLLQDKPTPAQIDEALRLLDLVRRERPALEPACTYWRAVAFLHQKKLDEAAKDLESILAAPAQDTPARRSVLFQAWQLALVLHPDMTRRVATPMLTQPGRRMEAIAAVERRLALKSDDQDAWTLKRLLYAALTEREYNQAAPPNEAAAECDHGYLQQLGLALVEDRARWRQGCDYLRLAARGLGPKGPTTLIQVAQAHEKQGDAAGMWTQYLEALRSAKKVGVATLADEDRTLLWTTVKQLGEHAKAEGDIDTALEAFKFYTQNDRAGLETWRTLADLFERKGGSDNVWLALHCTEHGLTYDGSDRDLIARKDRYYFSISPDDLKKRKEEVYKWFDVEYCLDKARSVLERYNGDLDLLDWASHLTDLAEVIEPSSIQVKLLQARVRRLRGEINEAVGLLEEVRQNKPEKFSSEDEQEAWYYVHRLLGDLYLEEKPAEAIPCLLEFKNCDKSGADTMYKLGRAYEGTGEFAKAARCYESVTTFERHPLFHEAKEGLERLKRGAGAVG